VSAFLVIFISATVAPVGVKFCVMVCRLIGSRIFIHRTMQGWRKSVYLRQQLGRPFVEHLVEANDAAKFILQRVTASTS